jgi:heme/copper-type cytochrome/quinol oxidase subunit 3
VVDHQCGNRSQRDPGERQVTYAPGEVGDAQNAPPAVWTVIILTSTLVLAFAIFFGEAQARMHTLIVATIAVLVAGNLFLITELAYPYLGFGTSSSSLQEVDDLLRQY